MASRALALPAIAVAVLPKCPLCVMVVLSALGLAHPLHDTIFAVLQAAVLVAVVSLLVVRRRHAPVHVALGAVGACCVLLGSTGLAATELGYAGAVLLAAVWMMKPRRSAAPACGCAS